METHNADCLKIFPKIEKHSVDLVLADPPYGSTQCSWDSVIPVEEMWKGIKRVLKPDGICILFAKMPFSSMLVSSNIKQYYQQLVWKKNTASNFLNAKRRHLDVHEEIYVFRNGKRQPTYNPQMREGIPYTRTGNTLKYKPDCFGDVTKRAESHSKGERYPITVLKYSRPSRAERCHPTQKPVDLLTYLIKTYTNEGDTVLDFVMGSGSTGVAARDSGRKFIGIELDSTHFKTATDRLATDEEKWILKMKEKRAKNKRKPTSDTTIKKKEELSKGNKKRKKGRKEKKVTVEKKRTVEKNSFFHAKSLSH